jgi:Fe-S-cluster containining protein
MIIDLPNPFTSYYGAPTISQVDSRIFSLTYFKHCTSCTFCKDWCCSHGVDLDIVNVLRLQIHAKPLREYVRTPSEQWFKPEMTQDHDAPGGQSTRTATYRADKDAPGGQSTCTTIIDNACVFYNRNGRGCLIQIYCADNDIDYHRLKPMICCLFPVSFANGVLLPSDSALDDLVCLGQGDSLYRGARDDLRYYFGDEFIDSLDGIENNMTMSGVLS